MTEATAFGAPRPLTLSEAIDATAKAIFPSNFDFNQRERARSAIEALASAIEARRAETGTGSVHESAVGNAETPNLSKETPTNDQG